LSTRINHNILAMSIQRNIGQTQNSLDVAVNRLSSGLRINNAWDDAAGLAVSEKFRAQISGMNEAEKNANYNINLLSTAEGALSVIDEKLVRMRQLAIQASNGALSTSDRTFINVEFQQMKDEITRIANVTNYNGKKLLDGSLSTVTSNPSTGVNNSTLNNDGNALKFHIGANNISGQDYYYVNLGGATSASLGLAGSSATTEEEFADQNNLILQNSGNFSGAFINAIAPPEVLNQFSGSEICNYYTNQDNTDGYYLLNDTSGSLHALHVNGAVDTYYDDTNLSTTASGGTDVLNTATAQAAIEMIDQAIQSKDTMRAFIGAMVNRLQNNIIELQISKENAQSSESMIRDTDVADEMSSFTRAQILFNTGISMLSQANSIPQSVASLIG